MKFRQNPGGAKFSDQGGCETATQSIESADRQFEHYVANKSGHLTQVGLSRINHLIEGFVDCVLGAQVNILFSILSVDWHAKVAQTEFFVLFEDAKKTDLTERSTVSTHNR